MLKVHVQIGTMIEKMGDAASPLFLASILYLNLAIINGIYLVKKQGLKLGLPFWKYLILAFFDVGGAYFTLSALKYTSVTSWALIQPSGLLLSVPLSIYLLKASYNWGHLLSSVLAIIGVVILVIFDASHDDEDHSNTSSVLGDGLALLGTSFYSLCSILVEVITKSEIPQFEILTMLGTNGFLLTSFLILVTGEISSVVNFPSWSFGLYTAIVTIANFGYYMLAPVVFRLSGTAVMQVSLLGTNGWSVLGEILILDGFHMDPIVFAFALFCVISGVTLFTLSGDPYRKLDNHRQYIPLETEVVPQTKV